MFVDLMSDLYHTFTERFLRVQIEFTQPVAPSGAPGGDGDGRAGARGASRAPTRRYNALGILEDVPSGEGTSDVAVAPGEPEGNVDIGPDESPKRDVVARKDVRVIGGGRGINGPAARPPANTDWSSVGRNDPCPCGSGKKFKKCHGATV